MTRNSDPFPSSVREEILEQDDYRCQICGQSGFNLGGSANLQAHHQEKNPTEVDYHSPKNGTTLCERCHQFVTDRIPNDNLPFDGEEVQVDLELLPDDLEIVALLGKQGPLSVREIGAGLEHQKSSQAVRERLWFLAGHDKRVDDLDQPLVEQEAATGSWGLPYQVGQSVRGRLPEDKDALIKRIEDEIAHQLLKHGVSRSTVAAELGVHTRTTHIMEKRSLAYALPIGDESAETEAKNRERRTDVKTLETFLNSPPEDDLAEEGADRIIESGENEELVRHLQAALNVASSGQGNESSVNGGMPAGLEN